MTESNSHGPQFQYILNELRLRETEELLEIFQTNDREEWTDEAFDAMGVILKERLGEVPKQVIPDEDDMESEPGSNDWSSNVMMPTVNWLYRFSRLTFLFICFSVIVRILFYLYQTGFSKIDFQFFVGLGSTFITILDSIIQLGFVVFALTALAEILYVLHDIRYLITDVRQESSS